MIWLFNSNGEITCKTNAFITNIKANFGTTLLKLTLHFITFGEIKCNFIRLKMKQNISLPLYNNGILYRVTFRHGFNLEKLILVVNYLNCCLTQLRMLMEFLFHFYVL